MKPNENSSADWNPDVARVSQEMASRLRSRNVAVHESDSPDDIMAMLEAVEQFESTVQAAGGDLMMDEPPAGGWPQPDEARFLLPTRGDDESPAAYVKRLSAASAAARVDQ